MPLNPLNHHYAMETPASVYDEEAMTALELAGRTTAKVNETVRAFNELEASTTQHLENQDERLNKQEQEQIPNTVESAIQENIRKGTFDKSIDAYMGNLEARVDNLLGNVPEGSTTMDAEVIDGRLDINGKVHPNLGGAIRTQMHHAIYEGKRGYFYNRLNPDTVTHGKYVAPQGGMVYDNPNYYTSDYIPVSGGEKFNLVNRSGALGWFRFVCFYDSGKTVIPSEDNPNGYRMFEAPAGAYYMRVTISYEWGYPEDICVNEIAYGNFLAYGTLRAKPETLAPNYNFAQAYYYNRIVKEYCIVGYYPSNASGEIMDNPNYTCSNYIPVLPGETLLIQSGNLEPLAVRMVAAYDENERHLPELSGENLSSVTNPTKDIIYVRLALYTNLYEVNEIMVAEVGTPVFLRPGESLGKPVTAQIDGLTGGNTCTKKMELLSVGNKVALDDFPCYVRKNLSVMFKGVCSGFTSLVLGHGDDTGYGSLWVKVDPTNVTIYKHYTDTATQTVAHGLTVSRFLACSLTYKNWVGYLDITTDNGHFSLELGTVDTCGEIYAIVGQNMTDVSLCATCADFSKPLWLVGDSYFGLDNARILGPLVNMGYTNYLHLAQPGLTSARGFPDLLKALRYGTPKTLVWYMGMNDGSEAEPFASYFHALVETCKTKGITLIANKVPTVPGIDKSANHATIEASGVRYIDSHGAVDADHGWKAGLLSADNCHPSELGASVLACQMLSDVPEIMSYGRE